MAEAECNAVNLSQVGVQLVPVEAGGFLKEGYRKE